MLYITYSVIYKHWYTQKASKYSHGQADSTRVYTCHTGLADFYRKDFVQFIIHCQLWYTQQICINKDTRVWMYGEHKVTYPDGWPDLSRLGT